MQNQDQPATVPDTELTATEMESVVGGVIAVSHDVKGPQPGITIGPGSTI